MQILNQLLVYYAAGLTEPLSCIAHGWDRITPIAVGSRILIVGAGIIGNLWASILHLQGHRRVTVSEPQEARRKLFEKLGSYDKGWKWYLQLDWMIMYHLQINDAEDLC